jgi:hypothetical protein
MACNPIKERALSIIKNKLFIPTWSDGAFGMRVLMPMFHRSMLSTGEIEIFSIYLQKVITIRHLFVV